MEPFVLHTGSCYRVRAFLFIDGTYLNVVEGMNRVAFFPIPLYLSRSLSLRVIASRSGLLLFTTAWSNFGIAQFSAGKQSTAACELCYSDFIVFARNFSFLRRHPVAANPLLLTYILVGPPVSDHRSDPARSNHSGTGFSSGRRPSGSQTRNHRFYYCCSVLWESRS